jgi:glutathione peroxidase
MFRIVVIALAVMGVHMADTLAQTGSLHELKATSIDGAEAPLSTYKGKVLLVVNVASRCGYTSQYDGLQQLYTTYKSRGFEVLGFPSNDFGGQEPGSDAEIKGFCSSKFGVNFPMFSKVSVTGPSKCPVYEYLTRTSGGSEVAWNFEKFLVDKSGKVVSRYPSRVAPSDAALVTAIEEALSK